jgi:hypothetical protein
MPLHAAPSWPVQAPGRLVLSGSLPCGLVVYVGGHVRRLTTFAMGQAGRIGPIASPCWGGHKQLVGPIRPIQTRTDQMHRPAGDDL